MVMLYRLLLITATCARVGATLVTSKHSDLKCIRKVFPMELVEV
jgi:hypothetical protein